MYRDLCQGEKKTKLHIITDIREKNLLYKQNHMLIPRKKHSCLKGHNGFEGKAEDLEAKFTGCPSGSASSSPCVTPSPVGNLILKKQSSTSLSKEWELHSAPLEISWQAVKMKDYVSSLAKSNEHFIRKHSVI